MKIQIRSVVRCHSAGLWRIVGGRSESCGCIKDFRVACGAIVGAVEARLRCSSDWAIDAGETRIQ